MRRGPNASHLSRSGRGAKDAVSVECTICSDLSTMRIARTTALGLEVISPPAVLGRSQKRRRHRNGVWKACARDRCKKEDHEVDRECVPLSNGR